MIFGRGSKKVLQSVDVFLKDEAWVCFLSFPYVNGGKLFHRSKYKGPCIDDRIIRWKYSLDVLRKILRQEETNSQ